VSNSMEIEGNMPKFGGCNYYRLNHTPVAQSIGVLYSDCNYLRSLILTE
jgi:hypothetical protein